MKTLTQPLRKLANSSCKSVKSNQQAQVEKAFDDRAKLDEKAH